MSTRSIILLTGSSPFGQSQTFRLYKHCDGYPTGVLPLLAAAVRKAQSQCEEVAASSNAKNICSPNVEQVLGHIIGSATDEYGLGIRIDTDDAGKPARYAAPLNETFLGFQWDLEWVYILNLNDSTLRVYGGGYSNSSPQTIVKRGQIDPMSYSKKLKLEYQATEAGEIRQCLNELSTLGIKVNPTKVRKSA